MIACSSGGTDKTSGSGSGSTGTAKPAVHDPNSFGDGTWQVGKDIKPGTYTTTVPEDSFGCYWERDKNLSGGFDAVIANDNVDTGGHATVTIKPTDVGFKSQGCGTWRKS